MIKKELQQKLDTEKWLESESKGRDMCGAYDFCAYCENETEFPCANAYERMQLNAVKESAAKKAPKKTAAKKTTTKKETAAKKPAAKPAAKKAPAKKTTAKA